MKHQPKALASQTLRSGAPLVAQRVTERFSAEESRQDVFDFLRAITENLSEGLYVIDAAGCLTFMNQAAERMLGWAETELRGNDMHATIHFQHAGGTPFPRDECPLMQVIRAGHTHHVEEDTFTRKDGSTFPVAYISSPIITRGV